MRTLPQPLHSIALHAMAITVGAYALVACLAAVIPKAAKAEAAPVKPTVVLVHGAFAESASWDGVVARLLTKGYPVIAVANPLRGVHIDSMYVAGVLDTIPGAVVLVGHSYGGSVISNAANGKTNVKALVYVAAFAPEIGESAAELSSKYPGSTLGPTLATPVPLADGGKDLYIQLSKYHAQFAADLPAPQAQLMAVAQRPITEAAHNEASTSAAWKTIPSWFIYGSRDKNIPPLLQPFMAERARAKKIVEIKGASHVVMDSHADLVAEMIEDAAVAADQ
jgi:pimeloyl-ACP methyl ester carboxylesterase